MKSYKKRALKGYDSTSKKTNLRERRERAHSKRELLESCKEEELRDRGYEDVEEVLKQLEIGLEQCRRGEGITTEELLKKINKKYKKALTNLE